MSLCSEYAARRWREHGSRLVDRWHVYRDRGGLWTASQPGLNGMNTGFQERVDALNHANRRPQPRRKAIA